MNNDKFEKSINALKAARLSEDEKNRMFSQIRFAIREEAAQKAAKPKKTFAFSLRTVFASRYTFATLLLLIIVGGSAGVSFAAQNSLPGDFLYPVKTQVNEKIRTALAPTPEKKAEVESKITATRLEEAATLSAQGKLDAQKAAVITQSIAEHAPQADLNKEASQTLDASLKQHVDVLNQLTNSADQQDNNQNNNDQNNSGRRFRDTNRSEEVLKALTERAQRDNNGGNDHGGGDHNNRQDHRDNNN